MNSESQSLLLEMVHGEAFAIPNESHTRICRNLIHLLQSHITVQGRVFGQPFTVSPDPSTAVHPDVTVVCDDSGLDGLTCSSTPEFIAEVLSKGNTKLDLLIKFRLYQEMGVKEYWVVFPKDEAVQQYILHVNGIYAPPVTHTSESIIYSPVLKTEIAVADIFNS